MSRRGKVLVAMSGGVDSSVAAALLVREGYEVVGCFMRLGSPGEELEGLEAVGGSGAACDREVRSEASAGAASASASGKASGREPKGAKIGHQGCCSVGDAADARLVAAEIGIPFYVCNFRRDFGRIMDYFVAEYSAGRTPNPCVRCNDWLKFGKLHTYAKQIDAQFVASGHYARVAEIDGRPALLRGVDHNKDQSYVLFGATLGRLREMLLPIGAFEKARVREMARELNLPVFDKPDSQEICFVPDNDYAAFVERRAPGLAREGAILDESGAVVGTHGGQHRFTIGQRRGVAVALGHPVYVVGKDPDANTVTIGTRDRTLSAGCVARGVNWLADEGRFADWRACEVKIRSHGETAPAECRLVGAGEERALDVRFEEPQAAVAPGQAVVCYEGERVLGGGWIEGVLGLDGP